MSQEAEKQSQPAYYQVSDVAPAPGVVLTAAVALAAALVGGYAYALADIYSPLIYLNFIFVYAYGRLIGRLGAAAGRWGRVSSRRVVLTVTAAATLAGLYVSWAVWLTVIMKLKTTPAALVLHPVEMWQRARVVSDYGTWSLGVGTSAYNPKVTGPLLSLTWAAEAMGLLGTSLWVAASNAQSAPFCDNCRSWCSAAREIHSYRANISVAQLKKRLEAHDWSYLASLPAAPYGHTPRLDVVYHRCDHCRRTHMLSLYSVMSGPGLTRAPAAKSLSIGPWGALAKRMHSRDRAVVVMDKLLISPGDLDAIQSTQPIHSQTTRSEEPPEDEYVDLGT